MMKRNVAAFDMMIPAGEGESEPRKKKRKEG